MAGSDRDDSADCDFFFFFFANFVFTVSKSTFFKSANLISLSAGCEMTGPIRRLGGFSSWGTQKAPTKKSLRLRHKLAPQISQSEIFLACIECDGRNVCPELKYIPSISETLHSDASVHVATRLPPNSMSSKP